MNPSATEYPAYLPERKAPGGTSSSSMRAGAARANVTPQPFPRERLARVATTREEPDNLTHTKHSRGNESGAILHESSQFLPGCPAKSLVMPMRSNPAARFADMGTVDQFTAVCLPVLTSVLLGF